MLRGLFRKEYPIAVHTQWFQVVQSSIRILKRELNLDPIVDHGEWEGYMNTPELVKYKIPVAAGPRGFDYDAQQAQVHRDPGGVLLARHRPGQHRHQHGLAGRAAGRAAVPGLDGDPPRACPRTSRSRASRSTPARMLKLEKRLGSLEPGKDADICVWTGDPFDPRCRTQVVIIDGDVAYDAAKDGIRF